MENLILHNEDFHAYLLMFTGRKNYFMSYHKYYTLFLISILVHIGLAVISN